MWLRRAADTMAAGGQMGPEANPHAFLDRFHAMSKLIDKLERAAKGPVAPLGFASTVKREKVSPLLLIGIAAAGDPQEARLVAEAGLDAALITADGALSKSKMESVAEILLKQKLCEAAPTFSFPVQPQTDETFVSGTILIARSEYPEARRILRDNGAQGVVKQQPDQVIA